MKTTDIYKILKSEGVHKTTGQIFKEKSSKSHTGLRESYQPKGNGYLAKKIGSTLIITTNETHKSINEMVTPIFDTIIKTLELNSIKFSVREDSITIKLS